MAKTKTPAEQAEELGKTQMDPGFAINVDEGEVEVVMRRATPEKKELRLVIRLGSGSLRRIQKVLGYGIAKLMEQDQFGVEVIHAIIWVSQLKDYPQLTPDDVDDWLDAYDGSFADLGKVCYMAVAMALPGKKDLDKLRKAKEKLEAQNPNAEIPT